jgi:pimeloyl-ACP methyl ester carboxylesterase
MKKKQNVLASTLTTVGLAAMTIQGSSQTNVAGNIQDPTDIRPFHFKASDKALLDLKMRIKSTKWPDAEIVTDESQGVKLQTMQKLANYWANEYDWRRCEEKLDAFPQYITTIDGLDIHFIHVRSSEKNALPIIITHGWPGSIIEQMKIIGPLTNPVAYGGKAEDAFDVIIPSLPGYGFSGKPTTIGWNPVRISNAWIELMRRLGYKKFVAQGGDWGNAVSEIMALKAPPELLAIHTNMPATVPLDISKALSSGALPDNLSSEEKNAYQQLSFFYTKGLAYSSEMGLRPQTLYGIMDSPIGLAAWMLDHDAKSYELIARVFDGMKEGLSKDDVLDNITLYWLTNTGISSARLYWETSQLPPAGFFDPRHVTIPVAVSVFPDEIYAAPKSWAEKAYPNLIYFNKLSKGGHFAAWEQPQTFVEEMRMAFKSFR